jgi:oligoendopeptidase F
VSDALVNRVAELPRPSANYPRKFVPENLDLSDWQAIEPHYRQLVDRKINSTQELEKWLLDISELNAVVWEESARRYIAMTCATDNEAIEKAYLQFVEDIEPRIKPYYNQLDKKLVESPFSKSLDQLRYGKLLLSTRNSIELFREENIPLETELQKLSQRYQKMMGAMMVQFRGEELTMQQMAKFALDNDRKTRQEAWEASTKRRLEDVEKLEDLFDEMLVLREKVAHNAGFQDYRDYQFRRYERFDYTPADCMNFHQAVEQFVVPVTRTSLKERQETMGLESIRPWDTVCDRLGRDPLKPFETDRDLAKGCREIFYRLDDRLGAKFDVLYHNGLLDLASRKGKAPGGYQSTLDELRLPFIFMNAVGMNNDVFTLLHEGGHAFHALQTAHEPLAAYRGSPMEFAEVASMTMEHLGAPHLEVFYKPVDAARARHEHFRGSINLLCWIATVDAFQHWIYTHPGHTRKERGDYWLELNDRFGAGIDHTGWEDALRYRWQAQLHIFEYPFYYIEYGIAQLGALQIWRNSRKDLKGAIDSYLNGLQLGNSKPLPELFKTAGAHFHFGSETIRPLMEEVHLEVEHQRKMEVA